MKISPALIAPALLATCASSLVACERKTNAPDENKPHRILKRASFDMNCPAEQLDTFLLDEHTRAVVGCGKRASYNHICTESNVGMAVVSGLPISDTECHYELDALVTDEPAPAQPASAATPAPAPSPAANPSGPPPPPAT